MSNEIELLAAIAQRNNLSAAAIARKAGVSDRTVRNAFQGKRKPLSTVQAAISKAMSILLPDEFTVVNGKQSIALEPVEVPA